MTGTVVAALIGATASLIVAAGGFFSLRIRFEHAHNELEESISAQASQLREEFRFEGRRDRREIYAAALAALKNFETEHTSEAETKARIAVAAVELVARPDVRDVACELLEELCLSAGATGAVGDLWNQMLYRMRKDIGLQDS